MSDPQQNTASAVLIGLGELKGQMTSLQAFLASHTERMDRQDERMDRQDERMNEFSRKLHEHNQADITTHEAVQEKVSRAKSELTERITKVENKIAYWSGGLAIISLFIGVLLKKLGLV
ncbi:hypothetical protein [Magnetospirillum molischianum]|uniref:Uncharacterized protein n=1 Tax=Magnetospirillum molischianum DSM 120 TaxID=1150626 RepID=H8FY68_MAGML|nr:hypothetical protein [Magnetospirillum molischianum]CCG43306.1 hypothetical protein PHAMO_80097 [Magnetospirillum molischianum DSM 120]